MSHVPGDQNVTAGERTDALLECIAALRTHCPWTRALTHVSLLEYLIEEAHEVVETLERGTDLTQELAQELGDVLLQVVLHARIAEEDGRFAFGDVADGLRAKLIRRNPHVFHADGSLRDTFPATVEEIELRWDAVKRAEKPRRGSVFDGVPESLPALARAAKLLGRAERQGVTLEPAAAPSSDGAFPDEVFGDEEALGEFLLAMVAKAHVRGLDAERALRAALRRREPGQ
ncbi:MULTISPECIES: MazG nucleotide pyrophosphohydrolase domain-containing protein [Arthrobacter]|uniref:MazG nucleotide pyrophosphohydrolase domain-containing protein n=2 Tax=Arthrobacter TaxID=1663 RepID=A0ABU9KKK0_9MICC|nr:MazG nucleotide pyrophosphohydrolase domain-containing protein [Arthrobacter sp. YJM1]MDP5227434.1 MazG nucleotide pyrophosphohydrolase domain-containing protein [Arthrobacter sp. YJM1]